MKNTGSWRYVQLQVEFYYRCEYSAAFQQSLLSTIRFNMSIDLNKLNAIEEKLSNGLSLSNTEDIESVKNIIESFRRIWKWHEKYPVFSSELGNDSNIFRSIFNDLSSRFCDTDSTKLTAVCEYCDGEFPLLNNDAEYAYQIHEQTPEHIEAIDNLKLFHSSGVCQDDGSKPESDNNKQMISCTTAMEASDPWISLKMQPTIFCKLCKFKLPTQEQIKDHVRGWRHQIMIRRISPKDAAVPISSVNSDEYESKRQNNCEVAVILVSSMAQIYDLQEGHRLTYFLDKACILFQRSNKEKFYLCILCNCRIELDQLEGHVLSRAHKDCTDRVVKKSNVKFASFEVGIFHDQYSGVRVCHLCVAKLPENNLDNYNGHLQSKFHNYNVKLHFKSPRFRKWEKGIILRNGQPYCLFCNMSLLNLNTMQEHINDRVHTARAS